jgi:hypothetical protein
LKAAAVSVLLVEVLGSVLKVVKYVKTVRVVNQE